MKPTLLPRDEIHRRLQAMPSALRMDIASHIAALHIQNAKLLKVAEAAKAISNCPDCEWDPEGNGCDKRLAEALAELEADDACKHTNLEHNPFLGVRCQDCKTEITKDSEAGKAWLAAHPEPKE